MYGVRPPDLVELDNDRGVRSDLSAVTFSLLNNVTERGCHVNRLLSDLLF